MNLFAETYYDFEVYEFKLGFSNTSIQPDFVRSNVAFISNEKRPGHGCWQHLAAG